MLLFSENPFNLQQGDLIVAKVEAFNSIGYSLASQPNQDGTKVQTLPLATPEPLEVDLGQTNESQITLRMTPLILLTQTGGSPIVSYSLEWDGGQNNDGSGSLVYESLIGEASNNIQLVYTKDSLTSGIIYGFRYRARNIYGWSEYSTVLLQQAARHPDQPLAPVTSNTATSVRISWSLPYNGGSLITGYNLQIQAQTGEFFS